MEFDDGDLSGGMASPLLIVGELPRATVLPYARGQTLQMPVHPGDLEYHLDPSSHQPSESPVNDPQTDFGRLTAGKTIGKKVVIYTPISQVFSRTAPVDLMTLNGEDKNAINLCITLGNPQAWVGAVGIAPANRQNITGEMDNEQFQVANPGSAFIPPAVATIQWGIGGVQSTVEVDFLNGLSINLHASYVRMQAFLDAASIFDPARDHATMLSAFVGPGRPSSGIAQRTVQMADSVVGSLAVGSVLPIPKFAQSVSIVGNAVDTVTGGDLPLQGQIQFFYDVVPTTPRRMGQWFTDDSPGVANPLRAPIPNGAYFFRWVNAPGSATYAATARAIFQLAL